MCGIIGYVGNRECSSLLLDGLSRLEYRGYDSAGLAVLDEKGAMHRRRAEGKLVGLRKRVADEPLRGGIGIGHTRWATHGAPVVSNAHPHRVGDIAVVHNGIIENYRSLRRELIATGAQFTSETDSEVIAHLVSRFRNDGHGLRDAVAKTCEALVGAYSIVVLDAATPNVLVAARLACPLVIGLGEPDSGENFVASDMTAILQHTRRAIFLDEGLIAEVRADSYRVTDARTGALRDVTVTPVNWTPAQAEKGGFAHFMLKEIHEQPDAIGDTLRGRLDPEAGRVTLEDLGLSAERLQTIRNVYIVACGTSWHAALVGQYLFESFAGLSPQVALGSEFRYRDVPLNEKSLVIAVSQSGETADTLSAIVSAKEKGAMVLSICNVQHASIPRNSDATLYTHAGPEIGVASTKAFTTQLVALHLLALEVGRKLGHLDAATEAAEVEALWRLPQLVQTTIDGMPDFRALAKQWQTTSSVLFLGRGALYPIALEGALKLKEVSYIHAEGYAAGEMKHGPIALIEPSVPTIILGPDDRHFPKVRSNAEEIAARGGPVVGVSTQGAERLMQEEAFGATIPAAPASLLPILCTVPLQMLAYQVAVWRGTDVDQPRNLAKSVTVE